MNDRSGNKKSTGILGGTFDPIHLGHTAIAEAVFNEYGLERVILVPANVNPLRTEEKTGADADQRLILAHLATLEHPWLYVDEVEIVRGRESSEPSYTADTLEYLKMKYGDSPLLLIVGADNVAFHKWHRVGELPEYLDKIVVVSRPGSDSSRIEMESILKRDYPGIYAIMEYFDKVNIHVSSTSIRESLGKGIMPVGSLDKSVEGFITKYGLYGFRGES